MVSSVDIKNDVDSKPVVRRVASASAIGTAAEYYDFFAYGTAAELSLVISAIKWVVKKRWLSRS